MIIICLASFAGCQAPPNGSPFGGSSSSDALPRLDQICHHIVLTCNGTGGQDDVTIMARRQSGSIENTSVLLETDSIPSAWAKAVAYIERSASDLPFPEPAPHNWNALSAAVNRLHTRHWFVKIEKNGGWTLTAKRRAEDELFGTTDVFEAASPDDLTAQINRHMDALARK